MKRKLAKSFAIAEVVLKPIIGGVIFILGFVWFAILLVGAIFAAIFGAIGGEESSQNAFASVWESNLSNIGLVFFILGLAILILGLIFSCKTLKMIKKGANKEDIKKYAILDIIFFSPIVGIIILALPADKFDIVTEIPADTSPRDVETVDAEVVE